MLSLELFAQLRCLIGRNMLSGILNLSKSYGFDVVDMRRLIEVFNLSGIPSRFNLT